jgi:hypothetical protein
MKAPKVQPDPTLTQEQESSAAANVRQIQSSLSTQQVNALQAFGQSNVLMGGGSFSLANPLGGLISPAGSILTGKAA